MIYLQRKQQGSKKLSAIVSFALLSFALLFSLMGAPAWADDKPAAPATTPAPAAPTTPPAASTSPTAKPAPPTPNPGAADAAAQIIEIPAKPTASLSAKATWSGGFAAIVDAESKIKAAVDKAGLKIAGRPIVVFTQTDDTGFSYSAMLPLAEKPQGESELSDTVKLDNSPAGMAIKFEHRGPYDDIDSTYDLITAYLDEKGLEAQDFFVEEYLTDLKSASDPNLAVDIYVFIKADR